MPPSSELTSRQRDVLEYLERTVEARGYAPTLREIAAYFRFSGTRAVEKHLAALERKGKLRRGDGARAIDLSHRATGRMVPIVGAVPAGRPMLAEENRLGELSLDPSLARNGRFLLRVTGESMKDAGILDGDLVLVEPQKVAENGQIVVAMVDGEATVKRFFRSPKGIELRPENQAFQPMLFGGVEGPEVEILGRVAGVFRF